LKANILPLTKNEVQVGISKIERGGNLTNGIEIFLTAEKRSTTYSRLEKGLPKFINGNKITNSDFKKLHAALKSVISNHYGWMIGNDLKTLKSGFKEHVNSNSEIIDDDTNDNDLNSYESVTIRQAVGMHSGKIQFEGVIGLAATDVRQFLKKASWKCYNCEGRYDKDIHNIFDIPSTPKSCPMCDSSVGFENCHDYINARLLKIQPEDNTNDPSLSSLLVYVLNDNTENIQLSGRIKIYGRIHKRQDPKDRLFNTVVVANHVEYKDQQTLNITKKDKLEAIKFSKRKDLESALVNLFARDVIGEDFSKLSILLSAIGAPEILDPNTGKMKKRGRMNLLLIGPPGGAKTKLLTGAIDLRLNSKYVSGTNTTGGSLTSMVTQDEGKYSLRLGAAATAIKAFLVINEFDKLPPEHQNAILEVMEEGESVVNKYAFLRRINTQTTVIASSNPKNGNWIDPKRVVDKELPFHIQILSRFDIIIIYRRSENKEDHLKFADRFLNINQADLTFTSEFLQKYIEIARQIIDVSINQDAKDLLKNFYSKLAISKNIDYDVSGRTLATLERCAITFARFRLKNVVTEEIAQRAINFFGEMLQRLNLEVLMKTDPLIYAIDEMSKYYQLNTDHRANAIEANDVIRKLRVKDEIIHAFIGDNLKTESNSKLRDIHKKLFTISNNSNLFRVNKSPLTFYWKHEKECQCLRCSQKTHAQNDKNDKNEPKSNFQPKKIKSSEPRFKKDFFETVARKEGGEI
jgi:DNA replicative helicase MCM subunit Mcm2 (Cdc46/Mcm family)